MTQTIESKDISVEELFQFFYAVPDYQREYVWRTQEVVQLLADIHSEISETDPQGAPEYFIGSIVVCPSHDGALFDLIDGQQRLTTLFIALCAIRDRIVELGVQPPDLLRSQISSASVDTSGNETHRYRLELQYEDSGDVLVGLADGELPESIHTRSMQNIKNAYNIVASFLRSELGEDLKALRRFYGYLTKKVKLIRIKTEDVAKALKIFETINDRGVGLNPMDLLKNLLFMKANPNQFDRLKDHWKTLQDTIFEMGEKPLRFLRYFIFSRYDIELLREDEIYGWFSDNEKIVGYVTDPINFVRELVSAAQAYKNFRSGRDEQGVANHVLQSMGILGGQAARQHLILLLAGRHLRPDLFDKLVQEVENLFFCYVITREPTKVFERNFARWANNLRHIHTRTELDEFVELRFDREKLNLSERFNDAINRLSTNSIQKYRFRYVLSKLTQHVEFCAYKLNEGNKWLLGFTEGGYDIEHIFPNQPCEEAVKEFGDYNDPEIAEKLGNFVLVEQQINAALGNRPFSQKRFVYPSSKLLLTRALTIKPRIGVNTQIDRAVSAMEPYQTWDEGTVNERQRSLVTLARAVWGLPDTTQTS